MKNNCYTLLLFITFLLFSCKSDNTISDYIRYDKFPKEISLKAEGYISDDAIMRYPFRIRECGDLLYVLDLHGEEHFFHVFKKESFEYVTSFGRRGEGPEETLQAKNIYCFSSDNILTCDEMKREITKWEFSKGGTRPAIVDRIKIDDERLSLFDFALSSDTSLIFPDASGENRLFEMNLNNRTSINRIGSIPILSDVDKNKPAIISQAWNPYIYTSPKGSIIVVATQFGEVLEIYNKDKECKRIVMCGPLGEPYYKCIDNKYTIPLGVMGYCDIHITDKYIYAVFSGRTFKEISQNEDTPDGGHSIHVFDFNGKPVTKYILDYDVYGICVNETEKIIWACNVNDEEQILKYKLP